MKNHIILAVVLFLPLLIWSQRSTQFSKTLKTKGYTEVEWTFIPQMKVAATALDQCSTDENKCGLSDPVKDRKTKFETQITLGWSWGASQGSSIIKEMASFEKVLLNSKRFPKTQISAAFTKNPGYSYSSMSGRMKFYIQTMESIEDDE